ncbi:MAG: toxin-antitoxin system YwqK family antitoxin, partial [Bacteroidota bacterium]
IGKWKFYYETGELQAEGFFKNGSRSGNWKYFHLNGQLSATGNYSKGRKDGLWKYYYEDGKLRSEGIERDGQKEGFWKLYYESGETKASGNFDAGSGKYFEFYENGKQKSTGNVVNGKHEGKWLYYNEAGQEEGYAIFRRGVGKYQGYYENGALKMEGELENSKRVGIWKLYNTDGSLAGYYKPVYENDRPIFKTAESFVDDNRFDKPGYRVKKKKSRYFNPKVNEYRGYVFSTNPLMGYLGFIPVSLERYKQERLGYELSVAYHRSPFFSSFAKVNDGDPFYTGFSVSMRQKLYSEYGSTGMFYFGHQATFRHLNYSLRTNNPTNDLLSAVEKNYTYDLLVGTRWLKDPDNGGITWDVHLGMGIGHKSFTRNYDTGLYEGYYAEQDDEGLIFPIRFGLTVGYIIPRKRTSPVKIKS